MTISRFKRLKCYKNLIKRTVLQKIVIAGFFFFIIFFFIAFLPSYMPAPELAAIAFLAKPAAISHAIYPYGYKIHPLRYFVFYRYDCRGILPAHIRMCHVSLRLHQSYRLSFSHIILFLLLNFTNKKRAERNAGSLRSSFNPFQYYSFLYSL